MPDMRDAIAQYLAQQQGGGNAMMAPPPRMDPYALQGSTIGELFPGQGSQYGARQAGALNIPGLYGAPVPSDTGPMPGVQQMPTSPDYTGPQGTNAPPPQGFANDIIPPGVPQVGPPPPMPSGPPLPRPGTPDADFTGSPPTNTPMQAPGGPQVGGMDQAEWYRMYTGGR